MTMKINRFLSLLLCLLMMCAAAVCVNRSLFGHTLDQAGSSADTALPADTLTVMADGTAVIHTARLTSVPGYAGPVPLDIYVCDGMITEIRPLPNAETPSFFDRASSLLGLWTGKSAEEAARVKVDAVSGATYSSQAIIANVDAGISYYLSSGAASHRPAFPAKMWVALAVTLAACVLPLFVRNRLYNRVQLLANVIVLGFWCGQFLDYTLMLRYISSGMALPAALVAAVMLVAAFIYPLFGRPQHYCNHICPLGSAQILVADLCRYKIRIGRRVLKALDWFRKILWAVLMLLLWTDVWTGWMDLELFQAFMFRSAPAGIIAAALLFVLLSAVVSRPYCRFVCPTGSLFKRSENIG
ncbi:MAG: FMN-binding protein [Muribaculaceae bacterium]|nr:FMN-binding protein [Muribaculaceae bacterium]